MGADGEQCSSCLVASAATVRWPWIASSATLALNSAVNRLRVLMVDDPLRQQIHLNRLFQKPGPPQLERLARLLCGTIKRPLPRLRLAMIERRLTEPWGSIRPFRVERIVRISSSKTSQSLICEINVVGVEILLASR
jgi:hypothetical protein